MPYPKDEVEQLAQEHGVLLRRWGSLQGRCTEQQQTMSEEIAALQRMVFQLRAELVLHKSLLHWNSADHEQWRREMAAGYEPDTGFATGPQIHLRTNTADDAGLQCLEQSLRTADLVICQTGCINAGEYWRVEDHCKRTGKACVLVEQPDALRIVRIHPSGRAEKLATAPINEQEASS